MAINFPSQPTVNQTFTSGASTWQWNGTVWNLVPAAIPEVDLSGLATETFVNEAIAAIPEVDLTGLATETFVNQAIADIPEVDLTGLATETFVNQAIADIPEVSFNDLTDTPITLAGYGITDAATSSQGALADTAVQPNELEAYAQLSSAVFTGLVTLQQTTEVLNTKTGATGTVTHDFSTGAIWYHSSISADFTANFTNVPTTVNRAINVVLVLEQGATGFLSDAVEIDGVAQTINWSNSLIPSATANAIDIVSFTLIRTDGAWTVLGSLTTHS